jgi:hypothetical protein
LLLLGNVWVGGFGLVIRDEKKASLGVFYTIAPRI